MLILASLSPRRKELLSRLALPFTVIPAEVDESGIRESDPERAVLALSALKAQAVAKDHPQDLGKATRQSGCQRDAIPAFGKSPSGLFGLHSDQGRKENQPRGMHKGLLCTAEGRGNRVVS